MPSVQARPDQSAAIEMSPLLSELIAIVDTPEGRARLAEVLAKEPFPHFEAHPELAGVLVRIDHDGRRTAGRFIDRQFVPVEEPSS